MPSGFRIISCPGDKKFVDRRSDFFLADCRSFLLDRYLCFTGKTFLSKVSTLTFSRARFAGQTQTSSTSLSLSDL